MKYDIHLSNAAFDDLAQLKSFERRAVESALLVHLEFEPKKVSKSRIKHLRGTGSPEYRLRVDDLRVYYDVREHIVDVVRIMSKELGQKWLRDLGTHE